MKKIVCDWTLINKDTGKEHQIFCVNDAFYDEETNHLIIHSYGFTNRILNIEKYTIKMNYRLITEGEEIISQSTDNTDND